MADLLAQRKTLHRQVQDIDEKYQALEKAMQRLEPLANLGMAWAMTAHELNNLLMPVLNYSHLALQHPEDAALCQKALEKASLAGRRAAAILEKVMLLAEDKPFRKEQQTLSSILENVFTCIGRDFEKDKIRVDCDIDADIEVCADPVALGQVFMNLILNARHAMLERGGLLRIRSVQTPDGTRIEISDTGCGIESDKLKSIFTPFFTSGKDGGNGLGLAFCRKVIEAHDGFITVDSAPGKGTRFKILLPTYTI